MASHSPFSAQGRTDARDWLVEADEPLAGLQLRNGGELPGAIVAPSLLELVRKSRAYGLKLSRSISARDDAEKISAWVEVSPDDDGQGCSIAVSNWQSLPAQRSANEQEKDRQEALIRQFAELSARLGPNQEILVADSDSADLQDLLVKMRDGAGKPWTDFVQVRGNAHVQPVHWRLLDGVKLHVTGSDREWQAHLLPIGLTRSHIEGFELYLVADKQAADVDAPAEIASSTPEEAKSSLGSNIAPVLRQPVSRIIANAETIRTQLAGPLADEYSNYAADIATAGEHLLSLIDDLGTLELVEDESYVPEAEPLDLVDIAERAAGILGVRAQQKSIQIDLPKKGETAPAIGDFKHVLQILLNLFGNAIRYSPENSQIWVRVQVKSGRARIVVADQGEGLSSVDQRKIFQKFERLGRSGDGGSGLGLYISRRLAVAMEGALTVESEKGKGARFLLELPADK